MKLVEESDAGVVELACLGAQSYLIYVQPYLAPGVTRQTLMNQRESEPQTTSAQSLHRGAAHLP